MALPLQQAPSTAACGSCKRKGKVIIIAGPTGVGKSDVSLLLARALNGEIISADSVQVYRGLDVGSAKVPESERRGIPHHLIDIIEPEEEYSAGDFADAARQAADGVLARGKVPIVVGGTGFYLRTFMFGKPAGGSPTPQVEAEARRLIEEAIAARASCLGCTRADISAAEAWEAGVGVLRNLQDPEAAERIMAEANNWYRLQRAVQVLLHSGRPMSASAMPLDRPFDNLDYDFRPFFLMRPRIEVFRRVDARVEHMILGGLLDEAKMLWDKGLRAESTMATRAIGYRQALQWFAEIKAGVLVSDVQQLTASIQGASRRLNRKQIVFHRQLPYFCWLDATPGPAAVAKAIQLAFSCDKHHVNLEKVFCNLNKKEAELVRTYQTELMVLKDEHKIEWVKCWIQSSGLIGGDHC